MPVARQSTKTEREFPCHLLVLRAMLRKGWLSKDTGEVMPAAFMPRLNGNDDDGLSVVLADSWSYDGLVREAVEVSGNFRETFGVASLHCGSVRDLDERLNIVPDKGKHAYLKGVPRQDHDPAESERLAGLLARIARVVWKPDA